MQDHAARRRVHHGIEDPVSKQVRGQGKHSGLECYVDDARDEHGCENTRVAEHLLLLSEYIKLKRFGFFFIISFDYFDKLEEIKKTIHTIYGKIEILEDDFSAILELMKQVQKEVLEKNGHQSDIRW